MRKILVFLFLLIFLSSCNPYSYLRTKQIKYYSNSENYCEIEGKIEKIDYYEDEVYILINSINCQEKHFDFDKCKFIFYKLDFSNLNISLCDKIKIITTDKCFYNHSHPILVAYINDEEIIDFENGLEFAINWVNNAQHYK